jgi:hypothetical protein
MIDSGPVRNLWSTLSNKFEKQCISLAFIIRSLLVVNTQIFAEAQILEEQHKIQTIVRRVKHLSLKKLIIQSFNCELND